MIESPLTICLVGGKILTVIYFNLFSHPYPQITTIWFPILTLNVWIDGFARVNSSISPSYLIDSRYSCWNSFAEKAHPAVRVKICLLWLQTFLHTFTTLWATHSKDVLMQENGKANTIQFSLHKSSLVWSFYKADAEIINTN